MNHFENHWFNHDRSFQGSRIQVAKNQTTHSFYYVCHPSPKIFSGTPKADLVSIVRPPAPSKVTRSRVMSAQKEHLQYKTTILFIPKSRLLLQDRDFLIVWTLVLFFHATIIYSISGMWLQKFAQALSVELRPKNTWSTGTLNTTPAKSPAPRWTFKQALCQRLKSQTLDWASCLEKWYLFQERCFPTPLLTWWQSWAATLVLLLVSPLCTSSTQSTWFGNKLRTGGSRVWIVCVQFIMIIDTDDKLDLKIHARDWNIIQLFQWNKVALTLSNLGKII